MLELLARYMRLRLGRLPAYAPDRNPKEMIWSHLGYGPMADFVPRDVHEMDRVVQGHLLRMGKNLKLIRALWIGSWQLMAPPVNENLAT